MTEARSAKSYSLTAVFLVFACLIAAYVVVSKYWNSYNLAKGQLANTKSENLRLAKALEDSEVFLRAFQEQGDSVALVNSALPSRESDMANFISSLSRLSSESGLTLMNLNVTTSPAAAPVQNAIAVEDLNFTVSGSYGGLQNFLTKVEQHLRLIDIYHITIDGGKAQDNPPTLQYLVRARTYYQK